MLPSSHRHPAVAHTFGGVSSSVMTVCYCHAMDTPKRTVRITTELWQLFLQACDRRGKTRSERVVELIKADVDAMIEGSENE